jgi:hypothetical protein
MDDKIIIYIGENMHVLTIYLRKLAHFKFNGFLSDLQNMSCLAILGTWVSQYRPPPKVPQT